MRDGGPMPMVVRFASDVLSFLDVVSVTEYRDEVAFSKKGG